MHAEEATRDVDRRGGEHAEPPRPREEAAEADHALPRAGGSGKALGQELQAAAVQEGPVGEDADDLRESRGASFLVRLGVAVLDRLDLGKHG